jgi:hypothetical protein
MPRISPTRVLAATLAAAALSAPTAFAIPASDPPGPNATNARGTDVAAPDQQSRRDWRSGAGVSSLAATTTGANDNPRPGPPTWPVDPQPITAGQPPSDDDGGAGAPAPIAVMVLVGAGLALLAGVRLARPRLRAARVRS